MPEYLHPGVYIEETSYRGKPIQGVSTSTAGFVGASIKGREGIPTLVTSFNDFKRKYGNQISPPVNMGDFMGYAVKAFFDNGGSRGYIVRTLAADALASGQTYDQGTVLHLPTNVTVRGATRNIPLNSLRNVEVGSVLRVHTRADASAAFAETRTLQVESYDAMRNRVTVVPADEIPDGITLTAGNTYFLVTGIAPHGAGPGTGPAFVARNRGLGGDNISINIVPTDKPPVALTTASANRDRPLLQTLAVDVLAAAVNLELSSAALLRLRVGDEISVGTDEELEVQSITAGTLEFNDVGGSTIDYGADASSRIRLVQRGGAPLAAALDLGLITGAAYDLSAGGPNYSEASTPHGIVATLQAGDAIEIFTAADADVAQMTVTTAILAPDIAAGNNVVLVTPVTSLQEDPAIRLGDTSDANADMARLMVGDATGFTAPYRAVSAEPIAVSNGSAIESSTVLLADTGTNTLWVSKSAVADEFTDNVTEDNWTTLESLQVAADGDLTINVASTSSFYSGAKVEVDNGVAKFEATVASVDSAARRVTFSAGLQLGGAGNFIDVNAIPGVRAAYIRTAEIEVQVYEEGILKETFSSLSWNNNTAVDSYRRNFVERINDDEVGSKLVEITIPIPAGTGLVNQPTTLTGFSTALIGGSDGSPLTAVDLIGRDNGAGSRTGIEALAERDDISIVAVPGVVNESVQGALITHCERKKYRMAVLDGQINTPLVSDVQAHRNNYDTKYAAYYAPWLKTLDLNTGNILTVPPSGHVMGIYARSDATVGVHKAPANEVVRSISDVEFPFTAGEQDVLNPVGVNLIRDLTPRGIRVWGARTITSDQEWKYVNVRRLFIFMEHSIDLGTQWVVFEPNSESLWARVVSTITSFLTGVWMSGALMGTTPEEAFFVTCDRSTMTQDDIDNGRLICEIGVSPVMPAEFVIFKIGQFTASAS